jgi:hypothetical protein
MLQTPRSAFLELCPCDGPVPDPKRNMEMKKKKKRIRKLIDSIK